MEGQRQRDRQTDRQTDRQIDKNGFHSINTSMPPRWSHHTSVLKKKKKKKKEEEENDTKPYKPFRPPEDKC